MNISSSISNLNIPLSIIGGLNAISGSHEHRGSHAPNKLHMEEILNWYDNNNHIDIPKKKLPLHLVKW